MSVSAMHEIIQQFFCKNLQYESLDFDADIFEMGLVNSLFAIQIVNFLEGKFSIQFENEDFKLGNFNTINNICRLLEKKCTVIAI